MILNWIMTVFLLSRKTMSSFKRSDIRLFEIIIEQEDHLYLYKSLHFRQSERAESFSPRGIMYVPSIQAEVACMIVTLIKPIFFQWWDLFVQNCTPC